MPSSFYSPNFSHGFPEQGFGLQCANSLLSWENKGGCGISNGTLIYVYFFKMQRSLSSTPRRRQELVKTSTEPGTRGDCASIEVCTSGE